MNPPSPLVSANWLFQNANNSALIILDASINNPMKDGLKIENKIIPNALVFDWNKFSDPTTNLPNIMPDADVFSHAAQELGVSKNSLIVVYDQQGIYSSARVWWMFLAMGFQNCYVLNGGLPEWLKMGYSYVSEHDKPKRKGNFNATFKGHLISNQEEVFEAISNKNKCIIDARSEERFYGKVTDPRAGLRLGHIPNSINIPFQDLLFEHKMRNVKELEHIYKDLVDKNSPLIFTCGSGVTACIDALAATLIGYKNISVYDGSWSEWGIASVYPVE